MNRLILTNSLIDNALPKDKPYALSDARVPGLLVIVNPSGRKTFCLRLQAFRKFLGVFPFMDIKAARKEAVLCHSKHLQEIELKKKSASRRIIMPLNDLIDEYFKFKESSLGAKTLEKYRYTWKKYASEQLGSILISEITDTDINNLFMDLQGTKSCIKKLQHILIPAFRYGRQRGYSVACLTPDQWLKVKINGKDRYFTSGELKNLFCLMNQREDNTILAGSVIEQLTALRILIYTGCRVGEILNVKWSDVFPEEGYIQLWKTKTKKGRLVPLSENLQVLIKKPLTHKVSDYLFTSFTEPSKPMAHGTLTHTWLQLMDEGKFNRGDTERLCVHSLRHTFITVNWR